jgi:hypothetical protein
VQLTVSLTFEFEASQNLDQVETVILEAGRRAMRNALDMAVREIEESARACPACGGETLIEGSESRVVLATFGRVALRLRRLVCLDCGRSFRPADAFLSCLEGANVSGKLRDAAVLAGSSWPYETAARVLQQLSGAEISHETIRQVTNAAGKEEVRRQLAEAKPVVQPSLEEAKEEEERELEERLAAKGAPKGPKLLLIGLDGGWIPSRDRPGGMEGKVGVVATDPRPIGRAGRHRLSTRRYVASFEGSKELGMLAYSAASALGAEKASQQIVLGDGAEWIKREAKEHFPEALTILDWAHVARSVHKAIRSARPGKAFRTMRASLHQGVADLLWHGRVDEALGSLRGLRPPSETEPGQEPREPIRALEEAIGYLESQRPWLGDYQALRDQGYPVGSGMVEREVELVINRRMKRQGMRWKRENAGAVAALRTSTINADWDDPNNQPPQAQAA